MRPFTLPSQGVLTRTPSPHVAGLGGFFLPDRSWSLLLDAFHSSHGMTEAKRLVGHGTGRTPYGSMVVDNSSGSFDCAPITFARRQPVAALRSG
jgi:hypothetical protein